MYMYMSHLTRRAPKKRVNTCGSGPMFKESRRDPCHFIHRVPHEWWGWFGSNPITLRPLGRRASSACHQFLCRAGRSRACRYDSLTISYYCCARIRQLLWPADNTTPCPFPSLSAKEGLLRPPVKPLCLSFGRREDIAKSRVVRACHVCSG